MLTNIAPHIYRKRLLIEGFFTIPCDETTIADFFKVLTGELQLQTYGAPVIHTTGGLGKDENQGYDGFVPLIDSGIYIAVWANQQFFSIVLYTCKDFDGEKAVAVTKAFFGATEMEAAAF